MIRPQWILFLIILVNYDERKTASWPYGWVLTSNCWTTKDCYTRRLYIIFLQKMFVSRGAARNFPEVRTVASFPNDISRAWLEYISVFMVKRHSCLRKQPTFLDATNGFPAKWRLRNERRNSILMTRRYPDLGSASDGLKKIPKQAARSLAAVTTFTYKNREKTPNFMKKKSEKLRGELHR